MSKEKPKQYQVGIDTFERMKANATFEEAMGFIRWNIDKYNTRKKGSDIGDYKKIKDYCDEAIWWLENRHVAEFNSSSGVKKEHAPYTKDFNVGDTCVIVRDKSLHRLPNGTTVTITSIYNSETIYISVPDGTGRIVSPDEIDKL